MVAFMRRALALATVVVALGGGVVISAGPAQAHKCSKHYSHWACVPAHRSDVDCDQVSATDFRVFGRDIYGLDGDNDGIACES